MDDVFCLPKEQAMAEKKIGLLHVEMNENSYIHTHDFIEITFVTSGKGKHIIDGTTYETSQGDVSIINIGVVHQFVPCDKLSVYNCIFPPSFIDDKLDSKSNFDDIRNHFLLGGIFKEEVNVNFIKGNSISTTKVGDIFKKMFDESNAQNVGKDEVLRAYLIELLVEIFRLLKSTDQVKKDEQMERILAFIDENYNKKLTVKDLSAFAFFSQVHFSRIFKEYTGMTVSDYIQEKRIEMAAKMLKGSKMTISEIMYEVGYKDIKHFYELFKRVKGKSPAKYRGM